MAVRICLEIGHEASLRTKKTQEGFTHDWEVFVRGCDGAEIHYYVEKVVFYLHETFPKPRRVVKEPPYSVKESGYAGFNLPIDIYLRNSSEPKKIRFNYDLHLQQSGPPIIKVQKEKYVFNTVPEDFKAKLLKGGAKLGGLSSMQEVNDSRSSLDDKNQMTNKPKLGGCEVKKQKIKIGEPCRDFQELFGSPINMSKSSEQKMTSSKPDSKGPDKPRTKHSPHKESHKDKEKSKDKTDSEKKSREEKKQKERSKDRERSKDKSIKKDKEKSPRPKSPSPKRSPKRSSSPSRFSSPPVVKKESKQHDKEKRDKFEERKPKKEKRSKEHKENKERDGEKNKEEAKKESVKMKNENAASPHRKEKPNKEKPSKESLKEDKHSEKYKHKKKDKEKREKKEEKSYKNEKKSEKVTDSKNLFKTEQIKKEKPSSYVSPAIPTIDDDTSNSSTSSSTSSLQEKKLKEVVKVKEEKNQKVKKEKGENAIKCKRKSDSVEAEEPPEKIHKESLNNNSDVEPEAQKTVLPMTEEDSYFILLRELQSKIMGLKDNTHLQRVVKLIAETGRYEVSAHTFDFDLCLLERSTVQQLQEFLTSDT